MLSSPGCLDARSRPMALTGRRSGMVVRYAIINYVCKFIFRLAMGAAVFCDGEKRNISSTPPTIKILALRCAAGMRMCTQAQHPPALSE